MSIIGIILVALGATAAMVILLSYAPIHSTMFGKSYSPRLLWARICAPFDIVVTLILVMGTLIGMTAVTGIGNIVFNVATGLGISGGSYLVRKWYVPRWTKQYLKAKAEHAAPKRHAVRAW